MVLPQENMEIGESGQGTTVVRPRMSVEAQRGAWFAGVLSVIAIALFGLATYIFTTADPADTPEEIILWVVPAGLILINLISLILFRRDSVMGGGYLLLLGVVALPITAVFLHQRLLDISLAIILTSTFFVTFLVLKQGQRSWAMLLGTVGVVGVVTLEVINLPGRFRTAEVDAFGPYITLGLLFLFVWLLIRESRARTLGVGVRVVGLLMVVLLFLIISTLQSIYAIEGFTDAVEQYRLAGIRNQQIMDLQTGVWKLMEAEMSILIAEAPGPLVLQYRTEQNAFASTLSSVKTGLETEAGESSQRLLTDIVQFENLFTSFSTSVQNNIELVQAGEREAAIAQELATTDPLADQMSDFVDSLVSRETVALGQVAAQLAQLQQATILTIIGFILATVIIAIIVSVFIIQTITRPIGALVEVTQLFGQGDRSVRAQIAADEVGQLGEAFNITAAQIRELTESLEQRVANRTRALETSVEVGRRLSTILDPRALASEVVEQVKSQFNYYHAHIYFFDENREYLLMTGGTGGAGKTMLERGHRLAKGRGLVGRAADTNTTVFVPDVYRDPNWLPNPLLPETRSELAVPIAAGDTVLGVLDVQHNQLGVLDQGAVALLQSLASQVAIAYQNALAYAAAQKQVRQEVLLNTIVQKIQNTTTVEKAVQVAVREVGRAVGGQPARIKIQPGAAAMREPIGPEASPVKKEPTQRAPQAPGVKKETPTGPLSAGTPGSQEQGS